MKLSIVTVCLNEKNIERTCKSITSQTFQNFEWIVIDGKSDKKTLDKIKKYKDKISIFISEPDCGIYDAMNKGILHATGDYISFMNAGDTFFSKYTLSKIFTRKYVPVDIIYGDVNIIKNKKSIFEKNPPFITKNFFLNGVINHQAYFVKRELFLKYGLYDLKYKVASDYEKLLCWEENGAIFKYIPEIIAKHYRNGISSNETLVKKERNEIKKKYFSLSEKKEMPIKYKIKFCGIDILSIKEIFPKTYIKLFGIITLLKMKKNFIYLFGLNFLPIFKLKGNINE